MNSSLYGTVEQQVLPLARKPVEVTVPIDVVMKQKDFLGALNLCMNTSGLEDKEIYMALDIDPGHFSNIRKGKPGANFPPNKLNALMDLCGNQIPLTWLAHSRGMGLVMLESEAQRQLREEREARFKAEEKLQLAMEMMQRMK